MQQVARLVVATLLFFSLAQCQTPPTKRADYGKAVISDLDINHYTDETIEFTCKDRKEDFDPGYAKIEIKNDTLQIRNWHNDGFTGAEINFHIGKDLTIKKIEYWDWSDFDDGTTNTIEVMEAEFHINSNPFLKGVNGLKGNYYLKIKEVNSSRKRSLEKNTHIFTIHGIISCP